MSAQQPKAWPADDPRLSRIWLRKELIASGFTDRAIAAMVAVGELHRIRYGSYVSGSAWARASETQRHSILARAVVRRAHAEVVVSHTSAATEWEVALWDVALDVVHLTRRDQEAGRREAGVIQHLGELCDEDVVVRHGIAVTSPTRTALDCACMLDVERALVVISDLLHRGLTTIEKLHAMETFMSQWPGSLGVRVVLGLVDARCESVGERRFLYLAWKQGLPRPEAQHEVTDEAGQRYRLDFAWPGHKVWLEFDGRVKYERFLREGESVTDAVLREKRREEEITRLTGWRCIRITWADLQHPERTAGKIRALLFPAQRVAV
jgi:very-short-patch-repair endonuclease